MTTDGFIGLYVETRDYAATATFWTSLGFEVMFATDHGSGQLRHPHGGPYVFINEQHDRPLDTHPILWVANSTGFQPTPPADFARPFEPQHWDVTEALVRDPDGREYSLQAPLPPGVSAPAAHHG